MANEFIVRNGFISRDTSFVEGALNVTTLSATTYQNLPVSGLTQGSNIIITQNNSNYTISASITTGPFGISDSGGTYTFYNTLSSAMSAATSGQTIEMFTDVTETGNVSITLKQGVSINGKGNTYTYTNNSGTTFIYPLSGATDSVFDFLDFNIRRVNTTSTGAPIFGSFTNTSGFANTTLNFINSTATYTVTSGDSPIVGAINVLHRVTVNGLNCTSNGSGTSINCITANFCTIICNGTSAGFTGGSTSRINNSRITTTSGNGVFNSNVSFCTITCTSSGIGASECPSVTDSNITTNTGNGLKCGDTISQGGAIRCNVFSTSGICFRRVVAQNCIASTGSNYVVDYWFHSFVQISPKFYRNYFVNSSSLATVHSPIVGNIVEFVDSTIIQNGSGPGVLVAGTLQEIINCTIMVTGNTANCITASSASNLKYINNKFKGTTIPINANITQQTINTFDNQGNILL
jgi:hypothetical protein